MCYTDAWAAHEDYLVKYKLNHNSKIGAAFFVLNSNKTISIQPREEALLLPL